MTKGNFYYDGNSYEQESVEMIPNWKETTRFWFGRIFFTCLVIGAILGAMLLADPKAKADIIDTGNGIVCETDPAPVLLSWIRKRTLCDSAIAADGTWQRARAFYTPAHYVPVSCYGTYFISCSGGYPVDTHVDSKEVYQVTADTVLPDEPGHIGG